MLNKAPNALKQTLLYGFSIALMKGISLIMLPFIAHHLTTEDFGRLEVISTLAIIGSILVGMGLEDTLFRFAGACKDAIERKKVAAEIFSLALIIGIFSGIVGWVIAEQISHWIPGNPSIYQVRLVLLMLALEGLIAIPLGWFRMRNKVYSFFFSTIGRALMQAALVLIFLNSGRGVDGVLEAGLIAAILQAVIIGGLHYKDTGFHFSKKTASSSFTYSLPIVGSGLVAFALNGLDRWILADHTTLSDVAQFGVAAKFSLAVVLLLQPFGMWWSPKRFEVLNEANGRDKTVKFISIGISLALIITVMVGLSAPLLINWLMPESYAMSAQYIVGLVFIMLLKEITELVNIGCFTGKTTYTQLIINVIGAILGVIFMLWWTPIYGVWGIILALLAAQLLRLVLFFYASQRELPLSYPIMPLIIITGISIFLLAIKALIDPSIQQLTLISIGLIALLGTTVYLKLIPMPEKGG